MKKYYLNQKTKLLALSIFFTVAFASFTARAQYCSTGLGGGACGAGNLITAVEIVGTSLNSAGVTCTTQPDGGALTIVPPVGSATTTLTQGQTYSFSVTTDGSHIISIWIDYDNNQTYDPTEWTQVCTTSATGVANTVSITIPYAPFTGTTGMRVRSRANGNQNDAVAACIQFGSGEAMDYTITIAAGSPCVAPPTAGATVSSVPTACLGTLNTLALNGNSIGAGQTYQWQSSPDNITWTNINGATNQSYNDSVIAAFYFRCELTCSGIVANSTSVFVGLNPANQCYCASAANQTVDDDIGYVSIATLENFTDSTSRSNATSVNTYTDFTGLTPTDLLQGASYPITIVQINSSATFYGCFATVHIDFNQDGIFNTTDEVFPIGATTAAAGGNLLTGTILIPFTSLAGNTRMRIVLREGGSATQSACGNYGYGETEDYIVNILAGSPCVAPPTAGSANASIANGCLGAAFSVSLVGNSIGAGQTYQWQSSADNITFTYIAGATGQAYAATISGTLYYQCIVTCSGASVVSSSVLVTQNPFSSCYCIANLGGAGCIATDWINNVTITSTPLNNSDTTVCSTLNASTLSTFPSSIANATAVLTRGDSYTLSVTTTANNVISVWIDYNQDGDYSIYEWTQVCTTSAANVANTVTLNIPFGIAGGQTGMRIRSRASGAQNDSSSACIAFGSGEAEDYTVTIDIGNSIKNTEKAQVVTVVPNPASDQLTLSFTNSEADDSQLKMLNLNGQVVFTENLNHFTGRYSKTIDVSGFAKGIYNLQLITKNGISNKKVVLN